MRAITLIISISFLLLSCHQKTTFETKIFQQATSPNCTAAHDCANIKLTVLEAKDKNTTSDSINKTIFNTVRNSVYAGENPKEVTNYTELAHSFVTTFAKVKTELAQDHIPQTTSWEASATTKIGFQSNQILNIVVEYYIFTGGAHGFGAVHSLLFNPKTGKVLPKDKIFSDMKKVTQLVENKFRTQLKIASDASFTDEGYFFKNDVFVLPQNILFTKKGVLFHYNQYEVASYANGPIDIELPYATLEETLLVK
jgi:hypothetical protein